jgi:uncharacterized protein (TIGR03067 family)
MTVLRFVTLLGTVLLCVGCGKEEKAPPKDFSHMEAEWTAKEIGRLQGTWRVVAIESVGTKVPDDEVQKLNLRYVIEGSKITVRRPGRPDNVSNFSIDRQFMPIRMTIQSNPVTKACYKLEENKLQLCLLVGDSPRIEFPHNMDSRKSPPTDLLTLERE